MDWAVFKFTKPGKFKFVCWVSGPDWGRAHERARKLHPDLFASSPKYPVGRGVLRPHADLHKYPHLAELAKSA